MTVINKPNRYPGKCAVCGSRVPKNGGQLVRDADGWAPVHMACSGGTPEVIEIRFSTGATVTRNRNGLCEDAPCCGCCS